jgi:hypothetical protein
MQDTAPGPGERLMSQLAAKKPSHVESDTLQS